MMMTTTAPRTEEGAERLGLEDAGADTVIFVLDEERDPDLIDRLGDAVR
jgi:hypothetical protein